MRALAVNRRGALAERGAAALTSAIKMAKALGELGLVLLLFAFGCSRTDARDTPAAPSAAPSTSAPIPASSVASAPLASVVVPVVDPGPPRQTVQGDGISITETGTGEVVLKTTSLWNEAVDTTYASCDYFRGAVPVLKRQLREDRAKLLSSVCVVKK